MYAPKFTITNKLVRFLGGIEAAKDVVENAPLVPDYEKQFQKDAIMRTVYHGTHIEGNDLTFSQTKQILEGATVIAQNRDVQEVINYRRVISIIAELSLKRGGYDTDSLRDIHAAVVYNIVPPEKAGFFRTTQVVIREEDTGNVILTPPQAIQVPFLLDEFFTWLNTPEAIDIHPVIRAAVVHYVLVTIHPFVEGNGRTTRAFANLVMLREGYDIKKFFSIEEHFDNDLNGYYDAFFKVDSQTEDISARDLTTWIEYFTEVVAIELTKIKENIRKLSVDARMKNKIGEQVALSARQLKLMEYISEHGRAVMKDLKQVLPMVSDDTVLRDLTTLTKKGIIEKEGTTKASSYILKT